MMAIFRKVLIVVCAFTLLMVFGCAQSMDEAILNEGVMDSVAFSLERRDCDSRIDGSFVFYEDKRCVLIVRFEFDAVDSQGAIIELPPDLHFEAVTVQLDDSSRAEGFVQRRAYVSMWDGGALWGGSEALNLGFNAAVKDAFGVQISGFVVAEISVLDSYGAEREAIVEFWGYGGKVLLPDCS